MVSFRLLYIFFMSPVWGFRYWFGFKDGMTQEEIDDFEGLPMVFAFCIYWPLLLLKKIFQLLTGK